MRRIIRILADSAADTSISARGSAPSPPRRCGSRPISSRASASSGANSARLGQPDHGVGIQQIFAGRQAPGAAARARAAWHRRRRAASTEPQAAAGLPAQRVGGVGAGTGRSGRAGETPRARARPDQHQRDERQRISPTRSGRASGSARAGPSHNQGRDRDDEPDRASTARSRTSASGRRAAPRAGSCAASRPPRQVVVGQGAGRRPGSPPPSGRSPTGDLNGSEDLGAGRSRRAVSDQNSAARSRAGYGGASPGPSSRRGGAEAGDAIGFASSQPSPPPGGASSAPGPRRRPIETGPPPRRYRRRRPRTTPIGTPPFRRPALTRARWRSPAPRSPRRESAPGLASLSDQRLDDRGSSCGCCSAMQVVGLGGREQDPVDAPADNQRQPADWPGRKQADLGHGAAQILRARRGRHGSPPSASIRTTCRSSRAKWLRKNGATTSRLGLEPPLEGPPERGRRAALRRGGAKVRAASPRDRRASGTALGDARQPGLPAGGEIGGEIGGERARLGLGRAGRTGRSPRSARGQAAAWVARRARAPSRSRPRPSQTCPISGRSSSHSARIVGDVRDAALAARPAVPAARARQPTLSDRRSVEIDRAFRPVRLGPAERGEMVLIGEARDRGIGLGLQIGREDAPSASARSWGIRPCASRFATSDVMKTVLPARLSPVTPSRITGSNRKLDGLGDPVPIRRRVRLSVRRARSKAGGPSGMWAGQSGGPPCPAAAPPRPARPRPAAARPPSSLTASRLFSASPAPASARPFQGFLWAETLSAVEGPHQQMGRPKTPWATARSGSRGSRGCAPPPRTAAPGATGRLSRHDGAARRG